MIERKHEDRKRSHMYTCIQETVAMQLVIINVTSQVIKRQ